MTDVLVKGLSKRFILPHEKKSTIFESIIGLIKLNMSYERFYALKNINMQIEKGECIGIIGDNGSGKSTLLKLISKILVPTEGSVTSEGRIASFLELGVGFQNELSAKENVYLYGSIMGMSRKEIKERYEHIVDFSGVRKFMDAKLKNFSSGMRVRIAFSTAIQTDPDILILDEILAVGDKDFQKKCHKVFEKFRQSKKTIIIASHDINVITKFCNKTLLLDHGRQVMYGDTKAVVKKYLGMKGD